MNSHDYWIKKNNKHYYVQKYKRVSWELAAASWFPGRNPPHTSSHPPTASCPWASPALKATASLCDGSWREGRELVMLLGSWGRRSEILSMSPEHPQHTHTHTRMLPTQLPVFAGLTDEVTRSWIRVTELAAISPPDTALFLGNTFQVPKYWLISSFWQLTHK